jgi:hypothetical protein
MISPTDTAYRLLPTSPSARELMDAYTPGLFELKFAEERTRRAAPRVGLLVLLKTRNPIPQPVAKWNRRRRRVFLQQGNSQ